MKFDDKILQWYADYIRALVHQYQYNETDAQIKGVRIIHIRKKQNG